MKKKKSHNHNGIGCLLNVLSSLSECQHGDPADTGSMVLGYGQHEVTVSTEDAPKRVLLSLNDKGDCTPVCQGDVNMVGYVLRPDGFVLYADIKSNTCEVSWVIEY